MISQRRGLTLVGLQLPQDVILGFEPAPCSARSEAVTLVTGHLAGDPSMPMSGQQPRRFLGN